MWLWASEQRWNLASVSYAPRFEALENEEGAAEHCRYPFCSWELCGTVPRGRGPPARGLRGATGESDTYCRSPRTPILKHKVKQGQLRRSEQHHRVSHKGNTGRTANVKCTTLKPLKTPFRGSSGRSWTGIWPSRHTHIHKNHLRPGNPVLSRDRPFKGRRACGPGLPTH